MEINAKEYEWDTGTNHKKSYNLFTIIAKQFGQLLGLGHCAPGDSEAACQQIVAVQGTSNPTSDSLLYKFIEPEVIRTGMSADDKAGLQSLYGTLNTDEKDLNDFMKQFKQKADSSCNPYPCVIPQNETDSRYILRADEITALQRHKQQMQASGLDSIPERLDKFKFIQKDYFTAFSVNGISAEDYLNESIDLMQDYIQDTPTELLIPSILDLSVTLDNRNRAITEHRNELDIQYLRFLEIELKVLIQIRRSMLDEIPKR
jgi:hypothetical protein